MKKIYRIMSFEEFEKYVNGEELIATNEPEDITTAKEPVFYFARNLSELSEFNLFNDILCEFEVDEKLLKKGFGKVQLKDEYKDVIWFVHNVPEYQITTYSNQTFKLIGCSKMEESRLSFKNSSVRDIPEALKEYIEKYHSKELPSYLGKPNVDFEMFEDSDVDTVLYEAGLLSELEYDTSFDYGYGILNIDTYNGIEEIREAIIETYYKTREYDEEDIDWDVLIYLRCNGYENIEQYEERSIKDQEEEYEWEEEEFEDIESDNNEMSNGYTPQEIADRISIPSTELQDTLGEIMEIKKKNRFGNKEKNTEIDFKIEDQK